MTFAQKEEKEQKKRNERVILTFSKYEFVFF